MIKTKAGEKREGTMGNNSECVSKTTRLTPTNKHTQSDTQIHQGLVGLTASGSSPSFPTVSSQASFLNPPPKTICDVICEPIFV